MKIMNEDEWGDLESLHKPARQLLLRRFIHRHLHTWMMINDEVENDNEKRNVSQVNYEARELTEMIGERKTFWV